MKTLRLSLLSLFCSLFVNPTFAQQTGNSSKTNAQQEVKNLLTNGDAEEDFDQNITLDSDNFNSVCAWSLIDLGTPSPAQIETVDGDRVFVVHAPICTEYVEPWSNQFFIQSPKDWSTGEMFRVSFRYKASESVRTLTQTHKKPREYLHWACIGEVKFTTEWQTFTQDVVVEWPMNGMTAIAFNLNEDFKKTATDFYFDDLVWEALNFDVYNGNSEKLTFSTAAAAIEAATSPNALIFVTSDTEKSEVLAAAGGKDVNVVVKDNSGNCHAEKIVLIDNESFYCPEDVTVENLTYTRSFSKNTWQPFFVPFSMNYDEWKDEANIAFINNVRQYDEDQDGVIERTVLEFITKNKGTVNPNTPYLIQSLNPGSTPMVLECRNTTLKSTPNEDPYISCASTTMTYKLSGTYQWLSDLNSKGSLVMSGGNFGLCAEGASLQPFRIYLDISNPEEYIGKTRAGSCKDNLGKIYISVDGEILDENEELLQEYVHQGFFDLQGRKLNSPTKGLNIMNGKIIFNK